MTKYIIAGIVAFLIIGIVVYIDRMRSSGNSFNTTWLYLWAKKTPPWVLYVFLALVALVIIIFNPFKSKDSDGPTKNDYDKQASVTDNARRISYQENSNFITYNTYLFKKGMVYEWNRQKEDVFFTPVTAGTIKLYCWSSEDTSSHFIYESTRCPNGKVEDGVTENHLNVYLGGNYKAKVLSDDILVTYTNKRD